MLDVVRKILVTWREKVGCMRSTRPDVRNSGTIIYMALCKLQKLSDTAMKVLQIGAVDFVDGIVDRGVSFMTHKKGKLSRKAEI